MNDQSILPNLRHAGLQDELTVLETIPAGLPDAPASPDEIDFVAIAGRAMNYLERNPVSQYDYQARFQCGLLHLPPVPSGPDPIAIGDTDCRMDWEFWNMREILGLDQPTTTELGLRRRIMGYVKDDHFAWCENGAAEEGKVYAGEEITSGLGISPWTTGKIIASLCTDHQRNGNRASLEQAGRMAHALTTLATLDTGRAYHKDGFGPWIDGKVLQTGWERQFPVDGMHLLGYYLASGDEAILDYCCALADGFVAELQPNRGAARIRPDGSHCGHAHITMHAVWGVAWLGEVTGHPKYIDFARRVYEFQRRRSYDTGWFSAGYWDETVARLSETCATADMISTAACLARAGLSEYWDHVERFVRNYIRTCQFAITPAYEAHYRALYPDRPREVDDALAVLRDFEGGFCGAPGPNDLVDWLFGPKHMNVSGCCSPEGMRSIHTAWNNTVIEQGDRILVNMSLPVSAPAATVTTALPDAGRVAIVPHRGKNVHFRPPTWTDRAAVRTFVDGCEIPAAWRGDYVVFDRSRAGAQLAVTYPLVCFRQRQALSLFGGIAAAEDSQTTGYVIAYGESHSRMSSAGQTVENSEVTFTWRGNQVVSADPPGPSLPLYR
ncbi:MAG: hypothetical protein GXY33_19315 [Phycisphaerae bacterium]|nr:hypothetical protein [Phycisphaerae bacterium]